MKRNILNLLYRWFDGKLDRREQVHLDQYLENSAELRRHKQEVLTIRRQVAQSAVSSFGPGFTQRVLESLEGCAMLGHGTLMDIHGFYESLLWSFRRVAAAGAAISIALLIYNLGIGDSFAMENIMTISDISFFNILDIPLF